ncbi:MAG: hypothetical protein NZT92_04795, partial [Abditibacteriales bacterium]|nr:hypothetical protein [Abditibacteriales bacterium]MDW8365249.1 hypothetical protein [Abditibacteriales bacterium]
SLQEPLGATLTLAFAAAVREVASASHPGMAVRAEAVLLLPEGACAEGVMVAQALRQLAEGAATDKFPFEMVYLLCPANAEGMRLSDEELRELCAYFLLLRTVSDLHERLRRQEFDFGPHGRLGTFGLSVLEFPAHDLVRQLSRHYGRQLVEKALLTPDPQTEAMRQAAQVFAGTHHLTTDQVETLRAYLLQRLENELTIGAFVFEEVPRSRWHIALATFDAFFRRERFGRVLNALRQNAERLRTERADAVRQKVDEIVESTRDPQNALTFLAALNRLIDETRKRFFTVAAVRELAGGESPPPALQSKLDELRHAVAAVPHGSSIVVKSLLLTLLLALPTQVGLNALAQTGGEVFAWLTAPVSWGLGLLLPAAFVLLAGWRAMQQAVQRVQNSARDCARCIEEQYKSELRAQTQARLAEVLEALFLLTLDTPTLRRDYPQYQGENECREVERLQQHLQALPTLLEADEPEERMVWRLNVLDWVQPPPVFPYRNTPTFADWQGECQRLIESGLLKGWRQTDARGLSRRVVEFTRRGVAYVLDISLDQFARQHLLQNHTATQSATDLSNQMRRRSRPLLLARAEGMKLIPTPLLGLSDPSHSALGKWLANAGGLHEAMEQALTYPQRYEFVLLQLAHHVSVDALRALPVWEESPTSPARHPSA